MKIKVLILGELICVSLFFVLICLMCSLIVNTGIINNEFIKITSDILVIITLVISSFITAKIGKERGTLYGIALGVVTYAIFIILSIIFSDTIDYINLITNFIIYISSGFIGGILGTIIKRKIKYS